MFTDIWPGIEKVKLLIRIINRRIFTSGICHGLSIHFNEMNLKRINCFDT